MGVRLDILLSVCMVYAVSCYNVPERDSKLSIFQVVKFANNICKGAARNGTCFTQAECDNMGGTKDGTCADGFGICCIVTLSSGQSSSVNNSYIVHKSTSTLAAGIHHYTICPASDDICRVKFDFTTFDLAGPVTGYGSIALDGGLSTDTGKLTRGNAIGDCTIDTFSITSPSGRSSPVICGTNANNHMIVDASGTECIVVNVGIGGTTSATRQLDIKVIQYRCGDEQGGPSGCLQYFDSNAGRIRSFNFPDLSNGATVPYNVVHLSRQHYKACVRRGLGKQYICYIPCTSVAGGSSATTAALPTTSQPSFGLGLTPSIIAASQIGTSCNADYITIPCGVASTKMTATHLAASDVTGISCLNRFCGRYLATSVAAHSGVTVCSHHVPFEVAVDFNDEELCSAKTGTATCEFLVAASTSIAGSGGITGFSLCYTQT